MSIGSACDALVLYIEYKGRINIIESLYSYAKKMFGRKRSMTDVWDVEIFMNHENIDLF